MNNGNVSDNGPQCISREFQDFAKTYSDTHTTSSPEYSQSNGFAERTIKIIKRTPKKGKQYSEDPYLALTAKYNLKSPACIFFSM